MKKNEFFKYYEFILTISIWLFVMWILSGYVSAQKLEKSINNYEPDSVVIIRKIETAKEVGFLNPDRYNMLVNEAYELATEKGNIYLMLECLNAFYDLSFNIKDYKNALNHKKEIKILQDSIFKITSAMSIAEMEARFGSNESRQKREILSFEDEINNFKIQKSIRVNAILFIIATILAGFIIFIIKIFFDRKKANTELVKRSAIIESQRQLLIEQKNKLNIINEELSKQISKTQKQKLEIEKTNIKLEATLKEIEFQNIQITDSILFAQNIQKSIMASEIDLRSVFSDFALFSQSKNLVSGDFIWFQEHKGFYYYAVADATGHGVPGAVVSVLCMVLLNQIINEDHNNSPKIIIEKLHSKLCNIFSANESIDSSELQVMESIDIALCRFDKDFNALSFCSAKRPMIICFEKDSIEILGDKFSVGTCFKKQTIEFTEQNLFLTKPFNVYLFTDGLQDQMNDKSQKIGYAKIKDFLMMNGHDSIHMVTQLIKEMFFKHKQNDIQTDDVIFTALRVN